MHVHCNFTDTFDRIALFTFLRQIVDLTLIDWTFARFNSTRESSCTRVCLTLKLSSPFWIPFRCNRDCHASELRENVPVSLPRERADRTFVTQPVSSGRSVDDRISARVGLNFLLLDRSVGWPAATPRDSFPEGRKEGRKSMRGESICTSAVSRLFPSSRALLVAFLSPASLSPLSS